MVRQAGGITEKDTRTTAQAKIAALVGDNPEAERVVAGVAGLIGLTDAVVPKDEAASSVRRLFEALAARRPLVVVLDDLHRAEPTLLDLIEHVVDWSRTAPMLLLTIARAELLEQRPSWGGGKLNATSMMLEPLDGQASAALLAHLGGHSPLSDAARDEVTRAAGGNPLFLQEIFAQPRLRAGRRPGGDQPAQPRRRAAARHRPQAPGAAPQPRQSAHRQRQTGRGGADPLAGQRPGPRHRRPPRGGPRRAGTVLAAVPRRGRGVAGGHHRGRRAAGPGLRGARR